MTTRHHDHPRPSGAGLRLPLFTRSTTDRVLAGVAGGLAARLHVDAAYVRGAFLVLASSGGGALAYPLAWLLSAEPAEDDEPRAGAIPDTAAEQHVSATQQAAGFVCAAFGALLLLRGAGIWLGDALSWPLGLAVMGSTLIWARSDGTERTRWTRLTDRLGDDPIAAVVTGPASLPRLLVGGALVLAGMGTVLASRGALTFTAIIPVLLAVAVTVAGLALIVGPWLWRLVGQLRLERRERIRSEERAEMAAHLHDSVLQTLALIQRADVPGEVVALARRQERELRAWLYGRAPDGSRLGAAVEAIAERVEGLHGVPVEVVVVGDAPLDERLQALVAATGEAISNAARHSGAERVSVYVEVEDAQVTAFVTDQGKGFDPERIPPGRMGIAASIRARLQRHGGRAEISSEPGEGTEVALTMPREAA